ncbi:MAG: hypothetical protein IBJ14_17255 [Hydrogenophaga sp.]|nr:hypothetical protein [Hydrogenophaga sp.]
MNALGYPASTPAEPRLTSTLRRCGRAMRAWPGRWWQAACRHAERADRFVPYY